MKEQEEKARLESLKSYEIMDTDPDSVLDSMTALASYVCETPISLISLLDDKRQWFKSRIGLNVSETPREEAFCNHAIEDINSLFIVEDALQDDRFKDNPLVIGDPNIRFYAGFPLVSEEGYVLGTLCVIDKIPRKLNEQQKNAIELLSKMALTCIETKRQQKLIREGFTSRKELISNIDFEMRAPLNTIMGVTTLLANKNKDETLADDLKLLSSSAESMVGLVNNLTESTDLITSTESQEVSFDLDILLKEVTRGISNKEELEIRVIYDFTVPGLLKGNEEYVSEILHRLIASRLLGRLKTKLLLTVVSLKKKRDRLDIRFELKDLSETVLPQDSRSLFEQNLEKNVAIDIINRMHGEFASQRNDIIFTLNFRIPEQKKVIESQPVDISGVNLLLVEDLEFNQRVAAQFLELWKVNYDIVENGEEAVDAVERKRYDIVLMDLRMPVMDGYEATRRINSISDVPIIALTASVSGPNNKKVKKLKLAGYVTKPFDPNELRSTIAAAMV